MADPFRRQPAVMSKSQRPQTARSNTSMRPPPRPTGSHNSAPSITGRAASPADSIVTTGKRKERDFDMEEGEETNIHVVVRCRGRSDREVKENSGVVVSTSGVKGTNVELSMGPNAISNKTYHFDKVFSPAADQAIVFEDVVVPILNEMVSGFNCTIFVYGQTGTGKTYTMSGDMTDTLGLLSDAAGIIPRTLYTLFRKLEADEAECSVKCSFIELYNEELRDLLSADDSVKLKIFDDTKKSHSATMVQGMEESHIRSATDGIKLLQRGSHRRQVAATKCNDLSSRSHTVFTITTYIKKTTESGEDYICAGKLNLVDLAGSENIQRSGAENKRAAEAGLINKSLLTLGRVINALADKGAHIPYRESKLTRLLQDSLGGRTKTCIIATVSPAKSNLEETISTLDYAFRAKNIRNKPQVNSMISKKTLLKEFTVEIEKLKSELIATRQRNGVYLSNEQFEEITVESESRRILSEEQKSRIETMETSLRNKVQELFNLTNIFTTLKRDNDSTRTTLDSTKDVLIKTEAVLRATQLTLEEETSVRRAHQETETRLKQVGSELIATVDASVKDLGAVHAKLRRRSELHRQNRQQWQSSADQVDMAISSIDQRFVLFQSDHEEAIQQTTDRVSELVAGEKKRLQSCRDLLLSKTNELEKTQTSVEGRSSSARDDMNVVLEEIKELREEIKQKVGEGLQGLNDAAAKISGEVIEELDQFHTQLHTSYSSLGKECKTLFEDMTKQMTTQRTEIDRVRAALAEANHAQIEASRTASSRIQLYLIEEKRVAAQEKQQLKDQIFALIDASSTRQEDRITKSIVDIQQPLNMATASFVDASEVFAEGMDSWTSSFEMFTDKVSTSKDEVKARVKKDWTSIDNKTSAIQASTRAVHGEAVKIVDAQMGEMASQMSSLDGFVTRARSQNDKSHDEHVSGLAQLSGQVSSLQHELSTRLRDEDISKLSDEVNICCSELTEAINTFDTDVRRSLETVKDEVHVNMEDYVPTGETPIKRDWSYPTELPETNLPRRSPGKSSRSPKKSPRKGGSPTKQMVFSDPIQMDSNITEPIRGLRELDLNVLAAAAENHTISFSRSVSGQPPHKKHQPGMSRSRSTRAGFENFGHSVGGRKLRSSPPE